MRRLVAITVCAGFLLTGSLFAGELTRGLDIKGGENGFAALVLERAEVSSQQDGMLTLQVKLSQAQKLKGYGFILQYDQTKYEYVESKEDDGSLLNTGSGQHPLFLSSGSKTPGQITIGAMKVDGESAEGDGNLVQFTFKQLEGSPVPTDFQILDGVLVDLANNIDLVQNIEIGNLKAMPEDYSLDQNMPNPFNPTTTISYQMPETGEVKLVLYNLLGQEVRTLINEVKDAGFYTAN